MFTWLKGILLLLCIASLAWQVWYTSNRPGSVEPIPLARQLEMDNPRYRAGHLVRPPQDFPTFEIWRSPMCPELPIKRLFLNRDFSNPDFVSRPSYVYAIDLSGRVEYWARYENGVAMDFKPHHQADGRTMYSYFVSRDSSMVNGNFVGETVLLDDHFEIVDTVSLGEYGQRPRRSSGSHEFLMLGPGHFISTALESIEADLGKLGSDWPSRRQVMDSVVQEVKQGKVVCEWRSSDTTSLYLDSHFSVAAEPNQPWDYAHLNSVYVDSPTSWLVSFRYLSEVVAVNPQANQVQWILGGRSDEFGLTANQRFSFQHCATRTAAGRLLVFDNGVERSQTRVVEYDLDVAARKLKNFKVVYIKDPRLPVSTYMGSVYELEPDMYLVCWGGTEGDGLRCPDVSILWRGQQVWTLSFTQPHTWCYRAYGD